MIIAYLAHPIGAFEGVTVRQNLIAIKDIVRKLNLDPKTEQVVPFVPYYVDCIALDDGSIAERERGLLNDLEFFKRRVMDQLWIYGSRISQGMENELLLCKTYDIPVVVKNPELMPEVAAIMDWNIAYLKKMALK